MKVENMTSSNGNSVPNQFEIYDDNARYFQSYTSIIVKQIDNDVFLDAKYWNYSKTTSKYRNMFLGETSKETQAKIDNGTYILIDLN